MAATIAYRDTADLKEIAGAPRSMVRKNHGGAGGGLFGVQQKTELKVYFFEGKKNQGKVQMFATAGKEHKDREAIYRKKEDFEESMEFQDAVKAGLKNLSKFKRGDSSSEYSREVQRLFLAWLPQEDRKVLEESEGLGNSQKAEVAWLEMKGYPYTAVEIDEKEWTGRVVTKPSPKVIGVAEPSHTLEISQEVIGGAEPSHSPEIDEKERTQPSQEVIGVAEPSHSPEISQEVIGGAEPSHSPEIDEKERTGKVVTQPSPKVIGVAEPCHSQIYENWACSSCMCLYVCFLPTSTNKVTISRLQVDFLQFSVQFFSQIPSPSLASRFQGKDRLQLTLGISHSLELGLLQDTNSYSIWNENMTWPLS